MHTSSHAHCTTLRGFHQSDHTGRFGMSVSCCDFCEGCYGFVKLCLELPNPSLTSTGCPRLLKQGWVAVRTPRHAHAMQAPCMHHAHATHMPCTRQEHAHAMHKLCTCRAHTHQVHRSRARVCLWRSPQAKRSTSPRLWTPPPRRLHRRRRQRPLRRRLHLHRPRCPPPRLQLQLQLCRRARPTTHWLPPSRR